MGDISRIVASQPIELTDGVSQTATLLTSAPVGTEAALVVRNITSGTQTVAGSVTATPTGTYTVTGTVTTAGSAGTTTVAGTVTSVPSGTTTVAGTVATTGTNTIAGTVTSVPSGTTTVTGTVTATPTGTYTVAGTVTSTPSGTTTVLNSATVSAAYTTVTAGTASTLQMSTNGFLRTEATDVISTTTSITGASTTASIGLQGDGSVSAILTLTSGSLTTLSYQFETSVDGTNWVGNPLHAVTASQQQGTPVFSVSSTTLPSTYVGNICGFGFFRVNITALTGTTPVVAVTIRASDASFVPRVPSMATLAYLAMTTASTATLVANATAGLSIYILSLTGSNGGTAGALATIQSATNSATTNQIAFYMAASGGGFNKDFVQPWKIQAATNLLVVLGTATNGYFSCNYYLAP